jgi:hypothetical protein
MYRRKPDLVISEKELYEMHQYALSCPLKLGNYSYRETQQALTLYSLLKFIESYGITPQFGLELMEEKYNVGERTED